VSQHVLASLTWDPGFRGILTVAVAVTVLAGSCFLILATNTGARLGFLLALTGLFGWFVVMGIVWSAYGIGYKGPAPSWHVVDSVVGPPGQSSIDVADSLPLPKQLPNPVKLRNGSDALLKEFPATAKDPTIGDIVGADPALHKKLDEKLAPWKILSTSNKNTGETQSVVAEALGPAGNATFANGASDYVVLDTFLSGGKKGMGDQNSILDRIKYKVTSPFDINHKPFRAAVQLQGIVAQTAKAGQAPPLPVRDPKAPVYTVILERDRGALRLPSIVFTAVCTVIFAILANMLHRRDKQAIAQRAAVAGAS
jgi:hypothetical protein